MLSYDIRSLEQRAVVVDGSLAPDDPVWKAGDPVPSEPIRASGRLSSAGRGRFYWHARLEGTATIPCRRCLTDATVTVQDEAHLVFADVGDDETEDSDVHPIDPRATELDLRPAIREQWILAAPGYALCREDCKGLCPRCGADLNAGPCDCPPVTDSRWSALDADRRARG
jgi:uncharacterized protein